MKSLGMLLSLASAVAIYLAMRLVSPHAKSIRVSLFKQPLNYLFFFDIDGLCLSFKLCMLTATTRFTLGSVNRELTNKMVFFFDRSISGVGEID